MDGLTGSNCHQLAHCCKGPLAARHVVRMKLPGAQRHARPSAGLRHPGVTAAWGKGRAGQSLGTETPVSASGDGRTRRGRGPGKSQAPVPHVSRCKGAAGRPPGTAAVARGHRPRDFKRRSAHTVLLEWLSAKWGSSRGRGGKHLFETEGQLSGSAEPGNVPAGPPWLLLPTDGVTRPPGDVYSGVTRPVGP